MQGSRTDSTLLVEELSARLATGQSLALHLFVFFIVKECAANLNRRKVKGYFVGEILYGLPPQRAHTPVRPYARIFILEQYL
jgi:hypothetical protein